MIQPMIELTILGTTAGVPTIERGHSALALKYGSDIFLFDCGENTQRQMKIADLSIFKTKAIFITHWHADHFAGLLGFLQTMTLLERKEPLHIFGPKPAKEVVQAIREIDTVAHIGHRGNLGYELIVNEASAGKIYEGETFVVEAIPAVHSIPAVSYKFAEKDKPGRFNLKEAKKLGLKPPQFGELQRGNIQKVAFTGVSRSARDGYKTIKPSDVMGEPRPGLKIVYTGDTAYNEKLVGFAKDVDLLIHEATYTSEFEELSKFNWHSTAKEAAEIAKKAKVKKLLLTHLSARYKDGSEILIEAKKTFKNSELAVDFMKISLK